MIAKPRLMSRGRSPRVRGSQLGVLVGQIGIGSIPACAGEPPLALRALSAARVDPRVCGGAIRSHRNGGPKLGRSPRVRGAQRRAALLARCKGRSPRVRGSLPHRPRRSPDLGSIPACAGEPPRPTAKPRISTVDPRVCGGAGHLSPHRPDGRGRSPRVRGSRRARRLGLECRGSIPACAGEPSDGGATTARPEVDPRVCGGA